MSNKTISNILNMRATKKHVSSIEMSNKRIKSVDKIDANRDMMSQEQIMQCEQVHQSLIDRIGRTVHDTKMSRFRGFVSPTKLNHKLLDGSLRMHSPQPVGDHHGHLSSIPITIKRKFKYIQLDPLAGLEKNGIMKLSSGFMNSSFRKR